ncbi:interleukin-31 receptor subunit alpha isoform X3 [Tachysurus fulvidraco]|uniref:interleukin-31 receptor subunit alpha isoform X3 n=1 Tax=Tachysurus fulvidraco TaxID=1234273 RepID=UPI001FEDB576|nr:interleukin-31 receptor subunit alpha isoform X3 [Tachysurus fulvidraco]
MTQDKDKCEQALKTSEKLVFWTRNSSIVWAEDFHLHFPLQPAFCNLKDFFLRTQLLLFIYFLYFLGLFCLTHAFQGQTSAKVTRKLLDELLCHMKKREQTTPTLGMERNNNTCAILLSWICRISMLLLTVSSPEPRIIGCELLEHANITCYWTAPSSENNSYMMLVTTYNCMNKIISKDSCNTTSTKCSVEIGSVSHCFCVDVLMLTSSLSTSLPTLCFNGINQVKMYTPQITALTTLPENGTCLKLEWKEPRSEYVHSERNLRVLQIEYHTPQQAHVSKVTAFLHDWWTNMCGLYPGTKHLVRVRAQDLRAQHHWSSWSGFAEAITAETAPVAAPELWRHIQQVDRSGKRRVTLLWKPLQWPNANGVILRYAASCQNEPDSSYWDCGHLDSYSTSCVLSVTAHACNCNLTASNSAGTSPSAHIYIPGDKDTVELQPPESISVNALDDFQLKVEWKALVNQSESSYVVEWFPIPETSAVGLRWKILNGFETSFIITGIQPEVPYNVSVRVLRKNTAGAARFAVAFTRQGAPSAGPKLEVLQTTSTDVTLKWKPVPLEKLRGFIQNYTVIYKYNGKVKSRVLNGNTMQFSLNGLSPGQYAVCVKAYTLTGGAESSWVTVTVGRVHIPVMAIVLCSVGSLLVVVIFLSQAERIQQCLCPVVPDPSKSSLSTWIPVSSHQHKLPLWDSPALFEPIYMGGVLTGHHVPHHLLDSKLQAFSQQKSQEQVCKQVLRASEQTFTEPNAQDLNEELTTDLSYQNAFMETSHCCHSVSSSCPEVPNLGKALVDSIFYESSIEPRLDSSYEKLESASATRASCDCAPLSKSCLRVDTLDQDDLFYRRSTVSNLKTYCYRHVSTSYLPVSDSYIDFRTALENSTNLIHERNFSTLESSCYSHVSASYLPIPEPSPAYADYVTVNSAAGFLHQSSHMPKKGACGYVHVSTSYLPIPLTSQSDSTFTNSIHENNSVSGLKSCIYNHLQINYQKSCPDFEVEEVYKPFLS